MIKLDLDFDHDYSDLVVGSDGTGMKVTNRGDWIRKKWKVRRGWIKIVILGSLSGDVIDIRTGNENLDERAATRGMIRSNKKKIKKVIMDGLHDCKETFDVCDELGIDTAIKIRKNAKGKGFGKRPDGVRLYQKLGYKRWSKLKQYGKRWPASEDIFSAVKRMFGETLMSHKRRPLYHEAKMKFWVYHQLITNSD